MCCLSNGMNRKRRKKRCSKEVDAAKQTAYPTVEKFIAFQLTSKLSSVNTGSDSKPATQEQLSITKFNKSPSPPHNQNSPETHLLALNAFEQKEIDALATAYETAFGNELTAKVIQKPQTVQQLLYNPDVYIRRAIAFCQHFAGFKDLSEPQKVLILKPFVFEVITLKFVFTFDPENRLVTVFSDNSDEEVYEVDQSFCMKYITDQSVPEENTRCSSEIRKSLDGDSNLRNLLSAQMLFQPREGVAVGNLEFLHYHFTYYSQLLQRYLESKYSSEEQAAEQYAILQGHRTHTMEIFKNNKKKIFDQIEGKLELPEILQELYGLLD